MENMQAILMLGCKGLKTSCYQFYTCRILLEYIIVVSESA